MRSGTCPGGTQGPDAAAAPDRELGMIEHRFLLGGVPHIIKEPEGRQEDVPVQEPGDVIGDGHDQEIGMGAAEIPEVDQDPGRLRGFREGLLEIGDDLDPARGLGRELPVVVGHDDRDPVLRLSTKG